MSTKILITGASGFIGKNMMEHLSQHYLVNGPSSSELNLLNSESIRSYLIVNKFDVIIHCATWNATSTSIKDRSLVLENNLRMFFNIARNSDHFGKMIYFGSGAEYNRLKLPPMVKEECFDSEIPEEQYGLSKYMIRKSLDSYNNIYDLVLFGVFGKYEDWRIRFISHACCRIAFDLPVIIKQNVFFDYLWVNDLVGIVQKFIKLSPKNKTYNICTGIRIDLEHLARIALEISGKSIDIIITNPQLNSEYTGSNKRFTQEFGEFNFTPFEKSIATLYSWYKSNLHLVDKSLL